MSLESSIVAYHTGVTELGRTCGRLRNLSDRRRWPPLQVGPLAREAAARAVRAEPNLAEVQCALAFVKFWIDWDWPDRRKALPRGHRAGPQLCPGAPHAGYHAVTLGPAR